MDMAHISTPDAPAWRRQFTEDFSRSLSEGKNVFGLAWWCVAYGIGIIGMLACYGLLQGRILSVPYGNDYFTVSIFLVLCNRLAAMAFALLMMCVRRESLANAAPLWKYLLISLSNVAASTCQYDALRNVSIPARRLGKSFKMIPVMLWGMVLARKPYSSGDWLIAVLVTGGVTKFLLSGEMAPHYESVSTVGGLIMLLCFLALGGFTSAFQEAVFVAHETSKYNQMLYINLGSSVLSLVTLLLSGSYVTALEFCWKHPALLQDVIFLSVASVGAQCFIYGQVKENGALVLAVTMNIRQVISALLSSAMDDMAISLVQVLALLVVVGSLLYKSLQILAENHEGNKEEGIPFFVEDCNETMGKPAVGASLVRFKSQD